MSGRVFISHASEDRDVAGAVCDALEALGVPCWIAPRDIAPGQDYAQALYEAIVECRALVLVLSAHSAASPQVLREVEQALRDRDPIVPFRIDHAELPPGLQFRIGPAEWLAAPSIELSAQVGMLAERVHAQFASEAGVTIGPNVPFTSSQRSWLGYPGILRRLTATWMTVFLWVSIVIGVFDLAGNLDALANIRLGRSLFGEEDVIERVVALSVIQLVVSVPAVFVWLVWLCAAYLTLEPVASGGFHQGAGQVPGRFLWPGLTLQGGAALLRELWNASERFGPPPPALATRAAQPPRWLWPWWWLTIVMVPLMLVTAIIASENQLSDVATLSIAAGTDLIWLAAAVLCLRFLKPVEKRLRRFDSELPSAQVERSLNVA